MVKKFYQKLKFYRNILWVLGFVTEEKFSIFVEAENKDGIFWGWRWVRFQINILTEQWSLNWLNMKESLQLFTKPELSDNMPKKSSQSERRNLITKISAAHNQSLQPSLHQRNCFWNLPQDSSKVLFFKTFRLLKNAFYFLGDVVNFE